MGSSLVLWDGSELNIIFLMARVILGLLVMVIVGIVIRFLLKKKPYLFELVVMTPGVNKHILVYTDALEFDHDEENLNLKIDSDRLFRVKPSFRERMIFRVRGVKNKFMVIYRKGKKTPVSFETADVSARVLKIIDESRALSKAMESEFSIPWDLKKAVIALGFLIIVVVAWLVATGQVVI